MTTPNNPIPPQDPQQPGYPTGQQLPPTGYPPTGYPPNGQYPPAGYPVPPAPKKKSKAPLIIGGIALGIVVLCGIGIAATAGSGSDKTSDSTSVATNGTTATTTADAPSAKIGTPVRDGKFEFVVSSVEPGQQSVGDNPYLTEKAQGQFVVVAITVKNTSDKPQSFSPTNQKLFDTSNRSFESDSMAQIALGGSDIPVWDNINPGNTVNVKLVFDMPTDATPGSIELHDSMFSDGATVSLK